MKIQRRKKSSRDPHVFIQLFFFLTHEGEKKESEFDTDYAFSKTKTLSPGIYILPHNVTTG